MVPDADRPAPQAENCCSEETGPEKAGAARTRGPQVRECRISLRHGAVIVEFRMF